MRLEMDMIRGIGRTWAGLYMKKMPPVQIMILTVTRELEAQFEAERTAEGKPRLYASRVRHTINAILEQRGGEQYSRSLFWHHAEKLEQAGLIWTGSPTARSSLRMIAVTPAGEKLFHYPAGLPLFSMLVPEQPNSQLQTLFKRTVMTGK